MKDIHDIVNRVTQDMDSDRRKIMIDNYINQVAASIQSSSPVDLLMISTDPQVAFEIREWQNANSSIFAYKVSEAAKIILRQELLGEK